MIHQDMEVEVVLDVVGNDFSRVLRITITTYLAKVHFLHLWQELEEPILKQVHINQSLLF